MEKMYGTYLGFMHSSESAVGMGELKIVIDEQHLTVFVATGLELEQEVLDVTDSEPLDYREIAAMFGTDFHAHGIKFRDGTTAVVVDHGTDTVLFLGGQPGYEMMGPTVAFKMDADSISEQHEDAIREIEKSYGHEGGFPRVATGGLAPRDCTDDDSRGGGLA